MDGYTVVEVWVLVDESGDAVATARGPEELQARWEEEIGDAPEVGTPTRIIRATLNVPLPKRVELCATVPDEPPAGELKVA